MAKLNSKDTNPKDAVGTGKIPYSCLPCGVVAEASVGMSEGARKYGRHNYRIAGVRASVYFDAAKRHLDSWWEGEDIDPDSELSHITKAICSLFVLRDAMMQDKWTDDRPPRMKAGWLQALNERAKAVVDKYPNPEESYTQKGMEESVDKCEHLNMYFAKGRFVCPNCPDWNPTKRR